MLAHRPLIVQIISQAERRALQGVPVPAGEKIVSLFEPLIVIENDLVGLAAETGLPVPAKCRMSRVDMVAIGPHTAGLYAATHPVGVVDVARPDARLRPSR